MFGMIAHFNWNSAYSQNIASKELVWVCLTFGWTGDFTTFFWQDIKIYVLSTLKLFNHIDINVLSLVTFFYRDGLDFWGKTWTLNVIACGSLLLQQSFIFFGQKDTAEKPWRSKKRYEKWVLVWQSVLKQSGPTNMG